MKSFLIGDCAPLNMFLKPVMLLGFRLYLAYEFFKSGLTKVDDKYMVTSSTIDLFKWEYMPYASEAIATIGAYLATYAELIIPVLFVLGFLTRPAALALFILNAVAAYYIYIQTDFNPAAGLWQHATWAVMIGVLFAFGPGGISIDKMISNRWRNN